MSYTLWMHDRQIGRTKFEFATAGRRRAGTFWPTEHGLTVLPGITAMFPALLAFGELCRREGLDVDDDTPEGASAALDAFGGTAEGQRVIAAAKQIAAVQVRDSHGRTMAWDSLAISDLTMLVALAKEKTGKRGSVASLPAGIGTFIVSLTLNAGSDCLLANTQHFGSERREPAPN